MYVSKKTKHLCPILSRIVIDIHNNHGLIKMIKNLTGDIYEHERYLDKHKDDTKVVLWTYENLLDPARHLYSVGKCVPVDQRNLKT